MPCAFCLAIRRDADRDDARRVLGDVTARGHFDKSGWRTHWVTTVGAGIAAVLQRPYDAVLLDLLLKEEGLPDGDGLDVLRAMRAHGLQTPVVICSSYGTERLSIELGQEFGVVTVLAKPVDTRTLLMCLAAAAAAAAAAKTTHDPLAVAGAELALVDFASASAAGRCLGILLRAIGDRALPIRPFARLSEEIVRLSGHGAPDRARAGVAISEAYQLRATPDQALDKILSVLLASEVAGAQELARVCEMSVKAVRKKLMDATGHGIGWWRRMARVRRFVVRLRGTPDQVAQCAFGAGYSNSQQASRDCDSVIGLSPTRVRDLAAQRN